MRYITLIILSITLSTISAQQLKQIQKGTGNDQIPVTNGTQYTQVYRNVVPYLLDSLALRDTILSLAMSIDSCCGVTDVFIEGDSLYTVIGSDTTTVGYLYQGAVYFLGTPYDIKKGDFYKSTNLFNPTATKNQIWDGSAWIDFDKDIYLDNELTTYHTVSIPILPKKGDLWYNPNLSPAQLQIHTGSGWVNVSYYDADLVPYIESSAANKTEFTLAPTSGLNFEIRNETDGIIKLDYTDLGGGLINKQRWSIDTVNLNNIVTRDTALISQIVSDSLATYVFETDTSLINQLISDSLATIVFPNDSTIVTNGTGISVVESPANTFTVTNTAPDQVVTIIGASGTYPNFTVANPPDSTVVQNSYGTIITESPSNTWNIKVDSTKFATPYDLTLIPNPPDSTVIVDGWGITSVEMPTNTYNLMADSSQVFTQYDGTLKQNTLISGTNIKTVNGNSLLGSGNVVISSVDSTGVSGGYGIDVTEVSNVFTVKADTSELSTPYDLTLKEDKLTFSNGLTRTSNEIKNDLITGKGTTQTIYGGVNTGNTLKLRGNTVDDNGKILLGDNAAYNEAGMLGIGTTIPVATLDLSTPAYNSIRMHDPIGGTNMKTWAITSGSGQDERMLNFASRNDAGSDYNFMSWQRVNNSHVMANLFIPHLAAASGTEVLTSDTGGEIYKSALKTINGSSLLGSGNLSVGTFTLPSLTSGSALFSNGTTIAQNNSNFFWNNTYNMLGIGTNTPTTYSPILNAGAVIYHSATPVFGMSNSTRKWLWYGSGNDLRLWNDSGNELLHLSGSRVGIKTPNPSYTLDVTGDFRLTTRSGTANTLGAWTAGGVATQLGLGTGLSISGGNLVSTGGTVTGTGTTNHVAFWDGTGSLSSNANFQYVGNTLYNYGRLITQLNSSNTSIAIGLLSGGSLATPSTSEANVSIGSYSGYSIGATATNNLNIGSYSGYNITSGKSNANIGTWAGFGNYSGNTNVNLGTQSGFNNTGSNNINVGAFAGYSGADISGNVNIGNYAGYNNTVSNRLHINNSDNTALISGQFDTDKVGIQMNATDITRTLDINGELRVRDVATTTPTKLMSIDNDGVVSSLGLSGLSISGGNLVGPTAPETFAAVGSKIQSWNSTGTFGSGKDVGFGVDPTREIDVNGDARLRGAIYDSANSAGSSGQVLTSQGSGSWIWATPTFSEVDGSITNEGYTGVRSGGSNDAILQGYNSSGTATGSGTTINGGDGIAITETTSTNGGTINIATESSQICQISRNTVLTSTTGTYSFDFTTTDINPTGAYTVNLTNNDITINNTGTYELIFSGVGANTSPTAIYFYRYNSGVWDYIYGVNEGYISSSHGTISFTTIANLTATDKIKIQYSVNSGASATFDTGRLIIKRIN